MFCRPVTWRWTFSGAERGHKYLYFERKRGEHEEKGERMKVIEVVGIVTRFADKKRCPVQPWLPAALFVPFALVKVCERRLPCSS